MLSRFQTRRQPLSVRTILAAVFQTTTFIGITAFVVAFFTLTLYLDQQYERTIENARVTTDNLTRVFEQHIVRSIKSVDQALLFVRTEFEKDPDHFNLDSWANHDYFLSDLAVQMALIGPDGMMVASNVASTGAVDLSDREHFKVHVDAKGDDLFISKPVLGRVSKRWTIQLTRRLRKQDGSFGGVLVASLDPYFLSKLYESIDIGKGGAITLVGSDEIIRARGGMNADVLGKSIAGSPLLRNAIANPVGSYETKSSIDDIDRIVSYRTVAGFPLLVAVAVARSEILEDYEAGRRSLDHVIFLIATLILAAMVWGVIQRYRLNETREDLLRKAQALSSTLTNMQEGIVMVDADGEVVIINDHALELLAIPRSSVTLPFPMSDLPLDAWDTIHAASASELGKHRIYEHTTGSGMVLEIRTIPMSGGGMVKTFSDITARKHDQRVLEDARDRAEAASRARTAFLATMSHEIRTPLSGVLSMVDLLSTTKLDDDQHRYLDITRDSAEHLLQLIDDILDVTKLDADQVKLENISFDLHRLVQSTLEIVSPKALDKGLSIGCLMSPNVPREIQGDPGRLRQILLNLIGNAVKFTSQGHVLLELSTTRNASGAERLLMRVEDTGIGMAKENLPELFRDFSQIDSSISRRFGGTGLGLAISRKLSGRMGGTISVDSILGAGTTFTVDLPLSTTVLRKPIVQEHASVAIAASDPFERDLLCRQLVDAFQIVEGFATISEASTWLAARGPEAERVILFLDSALAPVDGAPLKLPKSIGGRHIELFLVCAKQELSASQALQGAGFVGFIQKPVFIDAVRHAIQRATAVKARDLTALRTDISPTAGALAEMDVLLAEDNTTNQFALRRILEIMGARVTVVGNGRDAVTRASVDMYDVILMDMMMPELDGLSATREIRKLPGPFGNVAIVALTANAFVEDREAALAAGMDSFATKPITGKRLLDAIQTCLHDRNHGTIADMSSAPVAAPSDEPAAFDSHVLEELREELGEDYVESAIDIFLADLHVRIEAMKAPHIATSVLCNHSHALKSSAATLGLARLSAASADLERAIRDGQGGGLDGKIDSIANEANQAKSILKRTA